MRTYQLDNLSDDQLMVLSAALRRHVNASLDNMQAACRQRCMKSFDEWRDQHDLSCNLLQEIAILKEKGGEES